MFISVSLLNEPPQVNLSLEFLVKYKQIIAFFSPLQSSHCAQRKMIWGGQGQFWSPHWVIGPLLLGGLTFFQNWVASNSCHLLKGKHYCGMLINSTQTTLVWDVASEYSDLDWFKVCDNFKDWDLVKCQVRNKWFCPTGMLTLPFSVAPSFHF